MKVKVLTGCCCVAVLLAGAIVMGPRVTAADGTPEATVEKLGGYELPYSGSGSVIYDLVQSTWTIAFKAPEGWACTELGYAFKTEQRDIPVHHETKGALDLRDVLSGGVLDVHGALDLRRDDGILLATLETEDAVYRFEFVVVGELPVESLEPPGETGEAGESCPGGSCECTNGDKTCKACCPEGKSPSCYCGQPPACRCNKDKNKAIVQSAEVDIHSL